MRIIKNFSNRIVILLTIVTMSSCTLLSTPLQTFDYTELDVLSTKEAYLQVDKLAKQWSDDAILEQVLLFLYPKTENVPVRATFIYHSYSSPDKVISFDYTVRESVEIESREGNYENSKNLDPGLEPDILLLDSHEALKIMYEELGNEFFRECQVGSWPLIMTLEYGFPNVSEDEVWGIYFSCDNPEKGAAIIINANTGEVLEIRR